MVLRSQIIAWVAGAIAALALLLMFIALVVDILFAAEHKNGMKYRCGWDRLRFRGAQDSQDYEVEWDAEEDEQNTAGQIWLCFGIIALMWGLAGVLCSCIAWIPAFRLPGIVCLFLAGLCCIVAAACAFAFWADLDEWTCYNNTDFDLKSGASVILAFIAGFLFLFATCFMCFAMAFARGEDACCAPACETSYDSYDTYQESYCEPVQMKGPKCVRVSPACVQV